MENIEEIINELVTEKIINETKNKFVRENIETITKSNIARDLKEKGNYSWFDYVWGYQRNYAKKRREIKEAIYRALPILN
jgi:hypothetical protein